MQATPLACLCLCLCGPCCLFPSSLSAAEEIFDDLVFGSIENLPMVVRSPSSDCSSIELVSENSGVVEGESLDRHIVSMAVRTCHRTRELHCKAFDMKGISMAPLLPCPLLM